MASGLYLLAWMEHNALIMKICFGEKLNTFVSPSPCTLKPVVFKMDFSHVLKKIRNNMLKSGLHTKCTRIRTNSSLPLSNTLANVH